MVICCCRGHLLPFCEDIEEARDVLDNLSGIFATDVPPQARPPKLHGAVDQLVGPIRDPVRALRHTAVNRLLHTAQTAPFSLNELVSSVITYRTIAAHQPLTNPSAPRLRVRLGPLSLSTCDCENSF